MTPWAAEKKCEAKTWAVRSAATLARRLRRERAVHAVLGERQGNGWLPDLEKRLHTVAESLITHAMCSAIAGKRFHYAANAVLAARPHLPDSLFRECRQTVQAAGRAKHDKIGPPEEPLGSCRTAASCRTLEKTVWHMGELLNRDLPLESKPWRATDFELHIAQVAGDATRLSFDCELAPQEQVQMGNVPKTDDIGVSAVDAFGGWASLTPGETQDHEECMGATKTLLEALGLNAGEVACDKHPALSSVLEGGSEEPMPLAKKGVEEACAAENVLRPSRRVRFGTTLDEGIAIDEETGAGKKDDAGGQSCPSQPRADGRRKSVQKMQTRCPAGHRMAKHKENGVRYECDQCKEDIALHQPLLECEQCDYAVCGTCLVSKTGGWHRWRSQRSGSGTRVVDDREVEISSSLDVMHYCLEELLRTDTKEVPLSRQALAPT